MTQQLSEKSDVYSFGVVMLELVSGRQPIESGKYIVREVRLAMDPSDRDYYGLRGLLDPAIRESARTAGFRRFVQLAMRCVDESAAARPGMGEVVKEIEAMLQNEASGADGASSAGSSANEFDGAGGGARAPLQRRRDHERVVRGQRVRVHALLRGQAQVENSGVSLLPIATTPGHSFCCSLWMKL